MNKDQKNNEVEYRHRFLIDFWWIFGQFSERKSVQNRFRSGFGRALDEDSFSKLKKERAASIGPPKLEGFGAPRRGNKEGVSNCPHTPDNLSKDSGWRIFFLTETE